MKQGARAVVFGDLAPDGAQGDMSIGRRGSWIPGVVVSHDLGEPGKDWEHGYGLVQASASLEALKSLP